MDYKNIFDSHAHYDDEQFRDDNDALLSSFAEGGICGCVTCGTNTKNALKATALAEKYPFMYAAVGLHPLDIEDEENSDYIEFFRSLSTNEKVVAIGEIGLDYHYDCAPR
jgi:TatD DNase family protein